MKVSLVRGTGRKKEKTKQSEMTNLGWALRKLGGLGGASLGGMVGLPGMGASAGTSLAGALSKWLGSGDYKVGSNTVMTQTLKGSNSIPTMHNNEQSVVVRHREYVAEIRSNTNFYVNDSFELNPGNNRTFPWLSHIAAGFQEYRIKGLVWHYVPSSGNAVSGTSPSLGTVMLQTSYRSNDTPPASKMEVLNEYFSSESVPSEAFCHPIECDPKENPFNVQYVRTGVTPAGDNKLLYDLGVTHVCTAGQLAAGNVLGDLWCTYEVELKKPVVASNVTARYKTTFIEFIGTITAANKFTGNQQQVGNLEVYASGNTITLGKGSTGTWLIMVIIKPTTAFTACDLSGTTTYTDCVQAKVASYGTYIRTVLGGTSPTLSNAWYVTAIQVDDPAVAPSIVLPTGTLTGAATTTNIFICPATAFS